MPTTLSIITNVFPPDERGRAVGIWAGVAGAGAIIGLLLSGALLEWFSWPSVFAVNVALAALAFAAASRSCRPRVARSAFASTRSEQCSPSLGLFALVFAIIEAPQRRLARPGHARSASPPARCSWSPSSSSSSPARADARPAAVRKPRLRRRLAVADAPVLRPVRLPLHRAAIPPVRARLLAARGRALDPADGADARWRSRRALRSSRTGSAFGSSAGSVSR